MKPTLRRKDHVEVQSRVYMLLPGGGMCSAKAGTRGHIIDFFPQLCEVYDWHAVPVEMVAIVRLTVNRGETMDVCVNERALLLVSRMPRKRARTARQPRRA